MKNLRFALIFGILAAACGCVRSAAPGFPSIADRQKAQDAINALSDDQQVQTLETRIKLDPNDAAARLEVAGIYEMHGASSKAYDQYSALIHLKPTDAVIIGLGRCAQTSGRTHEGEETLLTFVKDSPSATAWDQLGMLYETTGDLTSAENAVRQALTLDPASDRLHNNLGYDLLLQKKSEAAESEFRAALELNSKSALTHNNLGVVLARRGDVEGALAEFEFAGDAATAHNNLAVALFEAGHYEQSRDELIKALTIKQYFEPALENFKLVQQRIRELEENAPAKKVPEEMK